MSALEEVMKYAKKYRSEHPNADWRTTCLKKGWSKYHEKHGKSDSAKKKKKSSGKKKSKKTKKSKKSAK